MDHDIAIDVELRQLLRRHGCGGIGRTRTDDDAEKEEKSVCERRGGAAEDDDGEGIAGITYVDSSWTTRIGVV